MKKRIVSESGGTSVGTGTGTKRLVDTKTDPRFGPNVAPIIREMVTTVETTRSGMNWTIVNYIHQCIDKFYGDKKGLQKMVREELNLQVGKEDADKRIYEYNKAILVGCSLTKEQVAEKIKANKTFKQVYAEVSSPKAPIRVSNPKTSLQEDSSQGEETPNNTEEPPTPMKQQTQSTGWTAPEVKPDDEKTTEDMVDIITSYFDGKSIRMKILFQALAAHSSRVKTAMIDALKES